MDGPTLRGPLAENQVPLYMAAAVVGVNPSRFGAMLRGRVPLRAGTEARLRDLLHQITGQAW